jgi:hypothetical protein
MQSAKKVKDINNDFPKYDNSKKPVGNLEEYKIIMIKSKNIQ